MKRTGIVKWREKEIKKELEREESKEREGGRERERERETEREKESDREWKRERKRERKWEIAREKEGRKKERETENVEKYYFVSTDKVSYMHIYTLWDTWHLSGSSLMKSNASVARTYRYLYCSILHEHLFSNKESDEKIIIILFFMIPLWPYW